MPHAAKNAHEKDARLSARLLFKVNEAKLLVLLKVSSSGLPGSVLTQTHREPFNEPAGFSPPPHPWLDDGKGFVEEKMGLS